MGPEAEIESAFVEYAESKGCLAIKLRIDGRNGFPDRTVLTPSGKVFFAEFKRPRGRLRPAQRKMIDALQTLGFEVIEPREKGVAESLLDEFLKGDRDGEEP